jgi:phage terminase small subunit
MKALSSDRQRRFVIEYLVDHNSRQAAIRAGYRPGAAAQQGCRLLTKDHVRAAVDECQTRVAADIQMSAEGALETLRQTILEARAAQQYGPAIRGLDLLGRHLGLWVTGRESRRKAPADAECSDEATEPKSDQNLIWEFAQDVRMMANQRQKTGATVEQFIDDLERLAGTQQALGSVDPPV